MSDYKEKFPRSVCGGNWRKKLQHPGLERIGACLAAIYKLDIDDDSRRTLIDMYAQLLALHKTMYSHHLINSDPLPRPDLKDSDIIYPFSKNHWLRKTQLLADKVTRMAVWLDVTPPAPIFEDEDWV